MPRKFVPRTLAQCIDALGVVPDPGLQAVLDVGADDSFFHLLSKPKSGDWLATHEEAGQNFTAYAKRMDPKRGASLPRPLCDGILLCPIGDSFAVGLGERFLAFLTRYCAAFFPGMSVEVLSKPLPVRSVQSRENDFGHPQYLIDDIFMLLNTNKDVVSRRRAYCRLGITLEDIYPGPEWNYVFGQARPLERVGVFSFARHSPLFYDGVHASLAAEHLTRLQEVKWLRYCSKTMVHESGHMLGMLHCVYFHCLMNGNNGPGDSNGNTAFLCPICLRKLLHALTALNGPPSLEAADRRYEAMQKAVTSLIIDTDSEVQLPTLHRDLEWLARRREHLATGRATLPPEPLSTTTERPHMDAAVPGRPRAKSSAATFDTRTPASRSRPSPGRRGLASQAESPPVQPVELRLSGAFGTCDCSCGGETHINAALPVRSRAKPSAATLVTQTTASRPPQRRQVAMSAPLVARTVRGT